MLDADSGHKSTLIKAVTNEWALLAYRFTTGGCALLMTWWVLDLKMATQDMRKDFNASLIANEARISRLEGQMSVFDNSLRMQTRSFEAHETTLQNLWSRIYDLNARFPSSSPTNR